MKPRDQIGKARNARINQAVGHAEELVAILRALQGRRKDQVVDDKDGWFDARTSLESLTQCIHEANAYNNSLLPEREVAEDGAALTKQPTSPDRGGGLKNSARSNL